MSVNAVSSTTTDPAAILAASSASGADTQQRFLKLLVTQLNNQDPLNPMDNAQLTSQLAQMSTVSGIEQMNQTLNSMLGAGNSTQMLQSAAMVGRSVLSAGNEIVAGNGASAFAVDLPASAASAKAVITDGAGNTVRTIDMGALPAGVSAGTWDGTSDAGTAVPVGTYQITVQAANGANPVSGTTLVYDQVTSVSQSAASGLTLDLASGRSIGLADVREVL
ncbi:MAG TPA: flagellar hook assembly protein FlgD [Ramlibacter sp.]|nr:flagellar hook assembly protein FlgD [Ramlibacter sp.]